MQTYFEVLQDANRKAVLNAMPGNSRTLCEKTGLNRSTVAKYINILLDNNEIYVIDREINPRGGNPVPVYDVGSFKGIRPMEYIPLPRPWFLTIYFYGLYDKGIQNENMG